MSGALEYSAELSGMYALRLILYIRTECVLSLIVLSFFLRSYDVVQSTFKPTVSDYSLHDLIPFDFALCLLAQK